MQDKLKQKVIDQLEDLSDDAARQLLDFMDFLESRYNRSRRPASTVEKIAQGIDETLGTGEFAATAAKSAAGIVDAAGKVVSNLASAGKAVAEELQSQVADAGSRREEPMGSGDGDVPEGGDAAEDEAAPEPDEQEGDKPA